MAASRAKTLPFWLRLYALLLVIAGIFGGPVGLPALDIPLDDPAYFARGVGLSAVLLVALWKGGAAVYLAGFAGAAVRDAGDLLASYTGADLNGEAIVITAIFLGIDLICLFTALHVTDAGAGR